jgi:hypothetical protein
VLAVVVLLGVDLASRVRDVVGWQPTSPPAAQDR